MRCLIRLADFGGIQLHAPVPLRLQDARKVLKTAAYAAINDHVTRPDDNACHYRLIDFCNSASLCVTDRFSIAALIFESCSSLNAVADVTSTRR